ncbi:MAG: DUF3987 domain-containing protein [Alphaproteobacteria bacterium]|nr:DUF3987 domain-containing protein [Alphaproteobacteria bacterium]
MSQRAMAQVSSETFARVQALTVAPALDWGEIDLDLLDERRRLVPPFPLDVLPPPWRDWIVEAARAATAPVDYVAQAVLAAAAGIATGGVGVSPAPGWVEPMKLWLAAVGAPSTGKSPALTTVRRLLHRLESERNQSEQSRDEGSPPRRIMLSSRSMPAIAAAVDESVHGFLLWHDHADGCLTPPFGSRGACPIENLPVSLLGTIEPDGTAIRPGAESALLARFLYAWPQQSSFCPLAERRPPRPEAVLAALRRLLDFAPARQQPRVLVLDKPAVAAFDAFLAERHGERGRSEGLEAAWSGKGGGAVARLACLLTLLAWSVSDLTEPGPVGHAVIERAIALWSDYYRPHARAFFRCAAPGDLDGRARRVVHWLQATKPFVVSREEVRRRALGETTNAAETDRVLARLVEGGALQRLAAETGPKGGRPALRWQVNPLLGAEQG